jgi:hypothetical protein
MPLDPQQPIGQMPQQPMEQQADMKKKIMQVNKPAIKKRAGEFSADDFQGEMDSFAKNRFGP